MSEYPPIPVPRQWKSCIKSAFIHTISLASAVFTSTCALAANRKSALTRLNTELAQAYQEIASLEEELDLKNERFCKIPAHKRPRYTPTQRLRILELRATRRWSITQTANKFLINSQTIISWTRRMQKHCKVHHSVGNF